MAPSSRAARLTRMLRASLRGLFDQARPFGRLALVHTVFSAATTLVTISLAGSLFFTVSLHESKTRVLLYLLLTLAPFAVVAPVLSPLLDRGATARRASVAVASGGSAVLALLMAGSLKGFLLFPEAFGILVLSKLYLVTKA
ncbi:MAG: MFS transporter, partial [Acidimicrobiales bacterium]